nr:reverse transcriptase domain-containing protein [Tanacetum cinerariifolium]
MSAMANTTLIVTTVTKTATKKKMPNWAEAASRVNILDFCEKYYEDILTFIDKIRRDKRKEVHTRVIEGKVHSNDLATLTRLARLSSVQTGNTLEMFPTVEVILTSGTLPLAETVLKAKTTPTASKNRMVWFDELPPKSIHGYKDLKAAFLAYFMQQKKYIKYPVEIHNIKQKDGETIKDFMKRFKVETGRMKGAPECMRIFRFMHGVNNPELTKRLNEHVPKTVEDMMTATAAFIRGETVAASKKKVHTPWKSHDHYKWQNSKRRSDFRIQQGMDGGPISLPP